MSKDVERTTLGLQTDRFTNRPTDSPLFQEGHKNKVAAAAVINKDIFSARLPDEATIFSDEAKAIELAFDYIKMSKYTYFSIFSDSLSCLQSLHNMNIDLPYILDILYVYVSNEGKIVNL